jgi:hypothetical protein
MRSLICCRARGHWVRRETRRLTCFHARRCAILFNRLLGSCGTIPRSFSLEARSPSEFLRINHRFCLSARALPTRVSALIATSLQRVYLARGFPGPRYVPSSGDHSLSTVCSALQLVSFFHPTTASRALPVQGFLRSAQPPSLIGRSCPHAVGSWPAHRRIGGHGPSASTSRPSSMQSRESQRAVVRPRPRPLPSSGLLLLQVFSGRCPWLPRYKRS